MSIRDLIDPVSSLQQSLDAIAALQGEKDTLQARIVAINSSLDAERANRDTLIASIKTIVAGL